MAVLFPVLPSGGNHLGSQASFLGSSCFWESHEMMRNEKKTWKLCNFCVRNDRFGKSEVFFGQTSGVSRIKRIDNKS